ERLRPAALPASGGDARRVRPAVRELAVRRGRGAGAVRAARRRRGGDGAPVPAGAVPPLSAGRPGTDRRAAARRRRAASRPAVLPPPAHRDREEPVISRRDAPQWMKEAGRAVTRTGGRLTSRSRMLPDFLMVGTQRGGTTSLFRALAAHPAIVQPNFHKGVHYFDVNYTRGLSWYRGHFPMRAPAERRVAASGLTGGKEGVRLPVAFESAGYYMHHPLAPERIARDLPGVKLIVLLRDPVIRAYSAHQHELARGFEAGPIE